MIPQLSTSGDCVAARYVLFYTAWLFSIIHSSSSGCSFPIVKNTTRRAPSYSASSRKRQTSPNENAVATQRNSTREGPALKPKRNAQQGPSRAPARVERKGEKKEYWDGLPPSDALDCRQCDSCACTDCETESDGEDFFADYE